MSRRKSIKPLTGLADLLLKSIEDDVEVHYVLKKVRGMFHLITVATYEGQEYEVDTTKFKFSFVGGSELRIEAPPNAWVEVSRK